MLIVQPDFASAEECAEIVAAFDAYQATPGAALRRETVTEIQGVRIDCPALTNVRERMIDHLQFYYAPTDVPEYTLLAELRVGGQHVLHADNVQLGPDGTWVPNHTPQRTHTALVYLNDDFLGGVIAHPSLGSEVSPHTGLLVSFPCSGEYEHAVEQVRSGRRMSLALWMAAGIPPTPTAEETR